MSLQEEVCLQWGVEVKNAMARLRNYVVEYGQRLASVGMESTNCGGFSPYMGFLM